MSAGVGKRDPSRFYLFPLLNGKKRLAYGVSIEDARTILSWRSSPEEMAQLTSDPPQEIRQQDIHQYLKELG